MVSEKNRKENHLQALVTNVRAKVIIYTDTSKERFRESVFVNEIKLY